MVHWPASADLVPSYAAAVPHYARGVEVRIEASTGRRQLLLLLAGLIGAFAFIRFSVRMIRRGTSWWPGNVEPGGMHIHHVVFGQIMMFVGGIGSFAVHGGPVAHDVLAVVFGAGCGLVLDEFALVLHLEDVYWAEEGRQSVDAVILAVAVIGLLLVGAAPLGGLVGGPSYGRYVAAAVLLAFVVVSLLKGKVWTGLLGVMLPLLAVVGALRLARPGSPWARWRYVSRPRRMARAERREEHVHRRFANLKTRAMDAVAGAPTPAPAAGAKGGRARAAPRDRPVVVEVPPSRLELLLGRALRPLREPAAAAVVWYLRIVTAVNVVTGVVAPFRDRVRAAAEGEYVTPFLVGPGFTGAVLAFVLSVSLRRRKRAAWILTVTLTGLYLPLVVVALAVVPQARPHPFNWFSLALTALLPAALLVSRTVFNVRGARGNAVLGLTSLVAGAAVAIGAGTLLVYATDRAPPRSWSASARYASVRVLTVAEQFGLPGVDVPGWTDLAVNLLSVALMVVVLLAFFRAPPGRALLAPADERRLRALLRVYGGQDSLGYFALRRDRSVCWSPGRDAAVVFRVTGGVALAAGDPVGAPAAWPAAVADWLAAARRHAWVPAVAHAGPQAAAAYRSAGLHALAAPDEPVLTAAPDAGSYEAVSAAEPGLRPPAAGPDPDDAGDPAREAGRSPELPPDAGGSAMRRTGVGTPDDGSADAPHPGGGPGADGPRHDRTGTGDQRRTHPAERSRATRPGGAPGDEPDPDRDPDRDSDHRTDPAEHPRDDLRRNKPDPDPRTDPAEHPEDEPRRNKPGPDPRTGPTQHPDDDSPGDEPDPDRGPDRRPSPRTNPAANPDADRPGDPASLRYALRVREAMGREGYTVAVRRQRDVGAAEWARVARLADAWRHAGPDGRRAARRRTVGLGRLGDAADGDCVLAECRDPRGRTCAVATCVPWGGDGLTLDLLGSDRESGPGPAEFVLAELLLRAGAPPLSGVRRVSLNLRPAQAFAAFAPHLRARALLYERRTELPRVLAAALTLRPPRPSRRARARARAAAAEHVPRPDRPV